MFAGANLIMKQIRVFAIWITITGFIGLLSAATFSQIPAPKDVLGFTPGDDRKLASWADVIEYFQKLDAASDRIRFEEIGKSTTGAPFVYATISSPENLKKLEFYKAINDKLADPRKFNEKQTRLSARPPDRRSNASLPGGSATTPGASALQLIRQGKTIVLITCGIHSTEVGSYLSSMLIAYRLASSDDPETKKILDNTIILLVPSLNPDGVDIVKNWYDKTLGTKWEGTDPPELYHKYVGHDLNRDWYAFTQVETQLTVDKIHNVWHPQIVLDIHQQGIYGARQFLPPYMQPVEPNVPKQIVEGYTELGSYMANDLRKQGFQGITTGTTYDAWTPSRAYSHYHGGVRILSETASARLATPVEVKFEQLGTAPGGLDAKVESPNFGPVWKGGTWRLRNITDYMTATAFSLLNHAADNRERWLSRFYEIGKEAVRPRKDGELQGFRVKVDSRGDELLNGILRRAGVEVLDTKIVTNKYSKFSYSFSVESFVSIEQPYGAFAKALFEKQHYPDLKDASGNPIPPYDVTAHTLSLLMDVSVEPIFKRIHARTYSAREKGRPGKGILDGVVGLYKSHPPAMDFGWTQWTIEQDFFDPSWYVPVWAFTDSDFRKGVFTRRAPVREVDRTGISVFPEKDVVAHSIIFPDQSPNQILNGYPKGSMPDEYVGGIGKEGVENLKKFVEAGGTLVFLNRASNFAIEQFNLPIRDVTKGLARKDFYIPGSILRTELDLNHPIAKGMPQQSIAWFENSPAFELVGITPSGMDRPGAQPPESSQITTEDGVTLRARIVARYPSDPKAILLSGWALGVEKIAGKAALVEIIYGKGKIVLFGFRPQYRGQSLATFPLLFNAISH